MAKVTNFLSKALLLSALAVSPMLATGPDAAPKVDDTTKTGDTTPADTIKTGDTTPADTTKTGDTTPADTTKTGDTTKTTEPEAIKNDVPATPFNEKVFGAIDYLNPFEYGKKHTDKYPTIFKTAKYLVVIGLVASNSAVQAAVSSLVSAVQSACGVAEEEAESEEPTRLTIGRQA